MSKLREVNYKQVERLWGRIESSLGDCDYLEQVAQSFVDIFYEEFEQSIVLIRIFATVLMKDLPPSNRVFVHQLAVSRGIRSLLKEDTLVLSLLGTRGVNPDWNDRRDSKEHVGIPFLSVDFIQTIPMISRLVKEMGFNLKWVTGKDTEFLTKNVASINGSFYVKNAETALDQWGRKIIPAQDFVKAHGVKTVFGFGGSYLARRKFVVVIAFARETIEREQAQEFLPLISMVKAGTTRMVSKNLIFNRETDH